MLLKTQICPINVPKAFINKTQIYKYKETLLKHCNIRFSTYKQYELTIHLYKYICYVYSVQENKLLKVNYFIHTILVLLQTLISLSS